MRSSLRRREGGEPYVSGCLINWRQNTFEAGGDGRGWRQEGGVKANVQCRRLGNTELYFITVILCNYRKKGENYHRKFGSLFTTL